MIIDTVNYSTNSDFCQITSACRTRLHRMSKNKNAKRSFPIKVYSPYDGAILSMSLEITVIPRTSNMLGNVIIRLNQGNVTIESYSMR